MSMTKILEAALREAEQLPEAEQQIIADFIIHFIHPEAFAKRTWAGVPPLLRGLAGRCRGGFADFSLAH